jgi:hypothetical protein
MSEAKFTKGPWVISRRSSGLFEEIGPLSADDYAGASWLDISSADAALISAAPDLYEALNELTDWADTYAMGHTVTDNARAALAKARGEA